MLAFERRWAEAVLAGFAPPDGPGLAPAVGSVDYVGTVQRMMDASTRIAAWGLRIAIWIAALSPMWLLGRLRTVRTLRPAERAEALDRLLQHRFRMVRELTLLLKLSACMALFRVPALRKRSHYDRPEEGTGVEESGERLRVRLPVTDDDAKERTVA